MTYPMKEFIAGTPERVNDGRTTGGTTKKGVIQSVRRAFQIELTMWMTMQLRLWQRS